MSRQGCWLCGALSATVARVHGGDQQLRILAVDMSVSVEPQQGSGVAAAVCF